MRVVVLGAGGPAGINSCRALAHAGHEVVATDANPEHLGWGDWRSVHMPMYDVDAVNGLEPDFVLPQPDDAVLWLALNAHDVVGRTFLPHPSTIVVCQDKARAQGVWHQADLTSGSVPVDSGRDLVFAAETFGLPYWLRARKGAGARCALKVENLLAADDWIGFWGQYQGVEFIAEEFLPGRDLAWTGIYWRGQLVTSFARERLEYLYPHLTPSGLTGTPTRARIVHDARVNGAAEAAVLAIDGEPHGIMSVDLKEDVDGVPRPTEINAGRGFTTLGLWSLYQPRWNFLDKVADLSRFDNIALHHTERDPLPEGLTLHRHMDAGHRFEQAKVMA